MNQEHTTGPGSGQYLALAVFVILCFAVAATGGLFPPGAWYRSLTRPAFAPPNWVFGPVWTVLYLMMAVSGWLVWRTPTGTARTRALFAFGVQLVLNGIWSALFFGWHRPGLALVEIIVLWLSILVTALLFRRLSVTAAMMLVPYLMWVSFAAVLNFGFWSLNS